VPVDAVPELGPGAQELQGPVLDEDAGLDGPVDLAQAEEAPVVLEVAAALEAAHRADAQGRFIDEGQAEAVVRGAEPLDRSGAADADGGESHHVEIVGARVGRPHPHVALQGHDPARGDRGRHREHRIGGLSRHQGRGAQKERSKGEGFHEPHDS
jgi:hypothetical protein